MESQKDVYQTVKDRILAGITDHISRTENPKVTMSELEGAWNLNKNKFVFSDPEVWGDVQAFLVTCELDDIANYFEFSAEKPSYAEV